MLVALAHGAVLEREGDSLKGGSEAVAGRLEQAAQIVKQVCVCGCRCRWMGGHALCHTSSCLAVSLARSGEVE